MNTDRELLELAAKAAGYVGTYEIVDVSDEFIGLGFKHMTKIRNGRGPWNPLTDDGDALRLAVKLRITPSFFPLYIYEKQLELARLSIVRAAADIGETMADEIGRST